MKTFAFLDLIDEDGRPTDKLKAIAGATEAEYREILAETVRAAYRDAFTKIDPSQDTQAQITDAFRAYEPKAQRDRMVGLFLALCKEAGIPVRDAPRERKQAELKSRPPKPRPIAVPKAQKRTDIPRNGHTPSVESNTPREPVRTASLLFDVSIDDVGLLEEDEFAEVWNALGKIARARARAKQQRAIESAAPAVTDEVDEDGEDEDET